MVPVPFALYILLTETYDFLALPRNLDNESVLPMVTHKNAELPGYPLHDTGLVPVRFDSSWRINGDGILDFMFDVYAPGPPLEQSGPEGLEKLLQDEMTSSVSFI